MEDVADRMTIDTYILFSHSYYKYIDLGKLFQSIIMKSNKIPHGEDRFTRIIELSCMLASRMHNKSAWNYSNLYMTDTIIS